MLNQWFHPDAPVYDIIRKKVLAFIYASLFFMMMVMAGIVCFL